MPNHPAKPIASQTSKPNPIPASIFANEPHPSTRNRSPPDSRSTSGPAAPAGIPTTGRPIPSAATGPSRGRVSTSSRGTNASSRDATPARASRPRKLELLFHALFLFLECGYRRAWRWNSLLGSTSTSLLERVLSLESGRSPEVDSRPLRGAMSGCLVAWQG
ncbi:hypothetical protein N658DRAFT_324849 [Parathielavia hyrcaniae]|uniref:Uncharacterized protein n=1 Tax=Parathielavia hyrcaniae TaxID=113614 RepID=A0AAN6Q5W1_9PEZI|nr:hypothetical protein N658DRAFT_324849 [Parathielavia hyrcaniae]